MPDEEVSTPPPSDTPAPLPVPGSPPVQLGKRKAPDTFKLQEAFAGTSPKTPGDTPAPPPLDTPPDDIPVNLVAVSSALERFIHAGQDKALHAALTAYPPLLDGRAITLRLDNKLLTSKAGELHPNLLAYLKQELKNSHVTLQFSLYEERQEEDTVVKRLYTSQDKLEHFITRYPTVQKLYDDLGLEIP